jgi:uncharacterized membrane protein YeaQ/YmgE (transglycosylase-associated protein family)
MEALLPFIVSLISGGAGGNIVGAVINRASMGTTGNSIVGALGGIASGYLLNLLPGSSTASLLSAFGTGTVGSVLGNVVGGGASGMVLTLVIGLISSMFRSRN